MALCCNLAQAKIRCRYPFSGFSTVGRRELTFSRSVWWIFIIFPWFFFHHFIIFSDIVWLIVEKLPKTAVPVALRTTPSRTGRWIGPNRLGCLIRWNRKNRGFSWFSVVFRLRSWFPPDGNFLLLRGFRCWISRCASLLLVPFRELCQRATSDTQTKSWSHEVMKFPDLSSCHFVPGHRAGRQLHMCSGLCPLA